MAVFSINQVSQMFVAKTLKTSTPTAEGDIQVKGTKDGSLYVISYGKGGLVRSDLIDTDKILYAKQTPSASLNTKLHGYTITVTGTPVKGQVYTLKINFRNYIGIGDEDTISIVAAVTAGIPYTLKDGETVVIPVTNAQIATCLADFLERDATFNRLAEISGSNDNVFSIYEIEQPWVRGKMQAGQVVTLDMPIVGYVSGGDLETNDWATVKKAEDKTANDGMKKLADLEYFTAGAKGDEYRGMGYPYNMDYDYMLDGKTEMDVISIHYFYQGANHEVQKSEKDLFIAVPKGDSTIAKAIDAIVNNPKLKIASA